MSKREYYEGAVDLFPSGLFGEPKFDGVSVLPSDKGYYSYEVVNAILSGSKLPSPDPDDYLDIQLSMGADGFSLIGNRLTIRIIESFPGMARTTVETKARMFVRRLSLITGLPITFSIRSIERIGHGQINPVEYKCIPYVVYKREDMVKAVARALTEMNEPDDLLIKSMDYFRLGELVLNIWGMLHGEDHFRHDMDWKLGNSLIGTAYLNFWKSITTVTDELGSTEFESRTKVLGLDTPKDKEIFRALRDLRNDFDIAHRNYDSSAIREPRHFINVIKKVAKAVIEGYRDYSRRTGKTFSYPRDRIKKRHSQAISKLERETGTIPRSKLDFGWAISTSETTNR